MPIASQPTTPKANTVTPTISLSTTQLWKGLDVQSTGKTPNCLEKSKKSTKDTEPGLGISAVIPTRGDVDLSPIVNHLGEYKEIKEIIIANYDQWVYNRYIGIAKAKYDIIYTQDDDCLVDLRPLIDSYEPGWIVNAMKADRLDDYPDMTLVGWGAIFDKELTKVLDGWEHDELFLRECDRVFTALNKRHSIAMDITDLYQGNRMGEEPRHWDDLKKIRERIWKSHSKNLKKK